MTKAASTNRLEKCQSWQNTQAEQEFVIVGTARQAAIQRGNLPQSLELGDFYTAEELRDYLLQLSPKDRQGVCQNLKSGSLSLFVPEKVQKLLQKLLDPEKLNLPEGSEGKIPAARHNIFQASSLGGDWIRLDISKLSPAEAEWIQSQLTSEKPQEISPAFLIENKGAYYLSKKTPQLKTRLTEFLDLLERHFTPSSIDYDEENQNRYFYLHAQLSALLPEIEKLPSTYKIKVEDLPEAFFNLLDLEKPSALEYLRTLAAQDRSLNTEIDKDDYFWSVTGAEVPDFSAEEVAILEALHFHSKNSVQSDRTLAGVDASELFYRLGNNWLVHKGIEIERILVGLKSLPSSNSELSARLEFLITKLEVLRVQSTPHQDWNKFLYYVSGGAASIALGSLIYSSLRGGGGGSGGGNIIDTMERMVLYSLVWKAFKQLHQNSKFEAVRPHPTNKPTWYDQFGFSMDGYTAREVNRYAPGVATWIFAGALAAGIRYLPGALKAVPAFAAATLLPDEAKAAIGDEGISGQTEMIPNYIISTRTDAAQKGQSFISFSEIWNNANETMQKMHDIREKFWK